MFGSIFGTPYRGDDNLDRDEFWRNREQERLEHSTNSQVAALEKQVDRLTLVCMAMWSLLQEKTGLTQQDLQNRIVEIDKMDGKEDGKLGRTADTCPQCQRALSAKYNQCMYCGYQPENDFTAFRPTPTAPATPPPDVNMPPSAAGKDLGGTR